MMKYCAAIKIMFWVIFTAWYCLWYSVKWKIVYPSGFLAAGIESHSACLGEAEGTFSGRMWEGPESAGTQWEPEWENSPVRPQDSHRQPRLGASRWGNCWGCRCARNRASGPRWPCRSDWSRGGEAPLPSESDWGGQHCTGELSNSSATPQQCKLWARSNGDNPWEWSLSGSC